MMAPSSEEERYADLVADCQALDRRMTLISALMLIPVAVWVYIPAVIAAFTRLPA